MSRVKEGIPGREAAVKQDKLSAKLAKLSPSA